MALTLEDLRATVIVQGIATAEEFDDLMSDLRAQAVDDGVGYAQMGS